MDARASIAGNLIGPEGCQGVESAATGQVTCSSGVAQPFPDDDVGDAEGKLAFPPRMDGHPPVGVGRRHRKPRVHMGEGASRAIALPKLAVPPRELHLGDPSAKKIGPEGEQIAAVGEVEERQRILAVDSANGRFQHGLVCRFVRDVDQKLSANPKELSAMIKKIRVIESMIGDEIKKCQPSEKDNKKAARRSLTALIQIQKGTTIKREMIGIQRPANGILPKYLSRVIGRKSKKNIAEGSSIKWNDLR